VHGAAVLVQGSPVSSLLFRGLVPDLAGLVGHKAASVAMAAGVGLAVAVTPVGQHQHDQPIAPVSRLAIAAPTDTIVEWVNTSDSEVRAEAEVAAEDLPAEAPEPEITGATSAQDIVIDKGELLRSAPAQPPQHPRAVTQKARRSPPDIARVPDAPSTNAVSVAPTPVLWAESPTTSTEEHATPDAIAQQGTQTVEDGGRGERDEQDEGEGDSGREHRRHKAKPKANSAPEPAAPGPAAPPDQPAAGVPGESSIVGAPHADGSDDPSSPAEVAVSPVGAPPPDPAGTSAGVEPSGNVVGTERPVSDPDAHAGDGPGPELPALGANPGSAPIAPAPPPSSPSLEDAPSVDTEGASETSQGSLVPSGSSVPSVPARADSSESVPAVGGSGDSTAAGPPTSSDVEPSLEGSAAQDSDAAGESSHEVSEHLRDGEADDTPHQESDRDEEPTRDDGASGSEAVAAGG
jgi:hypothetical protein